ncbi:hypothetical protein Tco_0363229 [Tanacetum coccineum]
MSDTSYRKNPYTAYPAWILTHDLAPLPAADQRHLWLRYQVEGYTEGIIHSYKQRLETIWSRGTAGVRESRLEETIWDLSTFGGIRRRMKWRQFILSLGLHTEQELAEAGFGVYWDGSDRLIPDKGDLRDY